MDAPTKRPRGRPVGTTKPPEERKSKVVQARVTPAQRDMWEALGAERWLRRLLDKALATE